MLSSLGQRGDAARLKKIGFLGYLTKPIKHRQLKECLKSVIGLSEAPSDPFEHRIITRHSLKEDQKHETRILIAEDNPVNQKLALLIVNKLGYQAVVVRNGIESLLAKKRFRLPTQGIV